MRVGVIGAGLGGLLVGAKLSRMGCDVDIYERLPFVGGRFTNIEYKGYQLTTGALHMIPHGESGPLGRMLLGLGAGVDIVPSSPWATIRIPTDNSFEDIEFKEFISRLSLWNKFMCKLLMLEARFSVGTGYSFKDWISRRVHDEGVAKLADSFCGWALSITSREVTASEGVSIIANILKYGGSGVPVGGCKSVINALAKVIEESGGRIYTNRKVDGILVEDCTAEAVCLDGEDVTYDVIISDLGHRDTQRLIRGDSHVGCAGMSKYDEVIASMHPSSGVKINVGSSESLIDHTGILLTPYAQRVNGLNQVTNVDPSLAPPGKHLIMAHMAMRESDPKEEVRLGLEDLEMLFPNADYEVLMVQRYADAWPVNRCAPGEDIGNRTPYDRLFVVGDGAKGQGGIEVDGIALGVEMLVESLLRCTLVIFLPLLFLVF
ncbi:phytoene dehydrogenase [Methanosarcinales archaeon ex4572_44]|nr:MAG: phytoene dehydrogenase [Methanosarcinales archaeon ex4572_44]RLG24744.1 MAG: NAD(P)/FAD-dependent oxidoreductase [Methanosarcinales archaeon]